MYKRQSDQLWIQRFFLALLLAGQVVWRIVNGNINRRQLMDNLIFVGPLSLSPVLLSAVFGAMIFTIQMARELHQFGVETEVGSAFAVAFCRELIPVSTAGILAGQVGSAFAAEIGSMKISEQIDALKILRTDPVDYLVIPKVIACCIMLPVLTIISFIVGIGGAVFVADNFYGVSPFIFLDSVRVVLGISDLITLLIKSLIFGAIIAVIGCNWGLTTSGGVKEVGRAATAAVVTSWLSISVVNFFLSLALFPSN